MPNQMIVYTVQCIECDRFVEIYQRARDPKTTDLVCNNCLPLEILRASIEDIEEHLKLLRGNDRPVTTQELAQIGSCAHRALNAILRHLEGDDA